MADGEVTKLPRSNSGLPSVIGGLTMKFGHRSSPMGGSGSAKPIGSKTLGRRLMGPSGMRTFKLLVVFLPYISKYDKNKPKTSGSVSYSTSTIL